MSISRYVFRNVLHWASMNEMIHWISMYNKRTPGLSPRSHIYQIPALPPLIICIASLKSFCVPSSRTQSAGKLTFNPPFSSQHHSSAPILLHNPRSRVHSESPRIAGHFFTASVSEWCVPRTMRRRLFWSSHVPSSRHGNRKRISFSTIALELRYLSMLLFPNCHSSSSTSFLPGVCLGPTSSTASTTVRAIIFPTPTMLVCSGHSWLNVSIAVIQVCQWALSDPD